MGKVFVCSVLGLWIMCLFTTPSALGVPGTMYTYEDVRLAYSARQHGLPCLRGVVEFGSLPPDIRYTCYLLIWCS